MSNQVKILMITLFVAGSLGGYLLGNSGQGGCSQDSLKLGNSGSCSAGGDSSQGLFILDGKTYMEGDLPSDTRSAIYELNNGRYNKLKVHLEEVAVRLSLASKKGFKATARDLPSLEELAAGRTVTEKEMKDFYNKNKGSLPPTAKFETFKPQIKRYLEGQMTAGLFRKELKEIKEKRGFSVSIATPVAPIVNIPIESYPSLGKKDSKLVLIEASDYLCGHCQRVHPEVQNVIKEFGHQIKFVQMNFALRPKALSGKMIRGAFCAKEQSEDKFWKYHHRAFELSHHDHKPGEHHHHNHNSEEEQNKPFEAAKHAQVDMEKFRVCIDSAEAQKHVEETNKILSGAGVSGTPSFFFNNRKLNVGAKGLWYAVKEAIEKNN